ncbi:MAG: substrate-binding periplasmic protein [Planctomycetota bacterium]
MTTRNVQANSRPSRRRKIRTISATAIATACTLVLSSGCHHGQSHRHDHREGDVTIATDAAFPPFHFVAEDDEVTGHDVALARAVMFQAGISHRVVVVRPYSKLLEGLETGQHQLVAATTGITKERQERFLFSNPYFSTCQAVLIRQAPGQPRTLRDLAGKKVGATPGGTSARALAHLFDVEAIHFESAAAGIEALVSGEIDGFVIDEYEAVTATREQNSQLAVLPEPAALEEYGFAMPADRSDLQAQVNRALQELERSGAILKIQQEFNIARDDKWPIPSMK